MVKDFSEWMLNKRRKNNWLYLQKFNVSKTILTVFYSLLAMSKLTIQTALTVCTARLYSHLQTYSSPGRQQLCRHWESLHQTLHPVEIEHRADIITLYLQHSGAQSYSSYLDNCLHSGAWWQSFKVTTEPWIADGAM